MGDPKAELRCAVYISQGWNRKKEGKKEGARGAYLVSQTGQRRLKRLACMLDSSGKPVAAGGVLDGGGQIRSVWKE